MKIYRVQYRDEFDESQGYEYFTSKRVAIRADKKNDGNKTRDEIEEIICRLNKVEILKLLNTWASHPDNG